MVGGTLYQKKKKLCKQKNDGKIQILLCSPFFAELAGILFML